MSTINVDNIAEYTSSGKINATHDIKMASGKSVLNSDGKAIGNLVKVGTVTASDSATVSIDNFVDTKSEDHLYDALRYGIMSRPRFNIFDFDVPISQRRYEPADSVFGY